MVYWCRTWHTTCIFKSTVSKLQQTINFQKQTNLNTNIGCIIIINHCKTNIFHFAEKIAHNVQKLLFPRSNLKTPEYWKILKHLKAEIFYGWVRSTQLIKITQSSLDSEEACLQVETSVFGWFWSSLLAGRNTKPSGKTQKRTLV